MGALEPFAIILSVVSLIISIVAFFASLKFYRDGVALQQAANDALTQISEKTAFIQTQVGGMFDKTLDAAIGKREILSEQFEELNEQLEKTKAKLIEESIGQIGAAGEEERKRLSKVVDGQITLIREKVETARESAEEMVQPKARLADLIIEEAVLAILAANREGLTFEEIYTKVLTAGHGPISVNSLQYRIYSLIATGRVASQGRKLFPADQ
jgi:hypothetical protein